MLLDAIISARLAMPDRSATMMLAAYMMSIQLRRCTNQVHMDPAALAACSKATAKTNLITCGDSDILLIEQSHECWTQLAMSFRNFVAPTAPHYMPTSCNPNCLVRPYGCKRSLHSNLHVRQSCTFETTASRKSSLQYVL